MTNPTIATCNLQGSGFVSSEHHYNLITTKINGESYYLDSSDYYTHPIKHRFYFQIYNGASTIVELSEKEYIDHDIYLDYFNFLKSAPKLIEQYDYFKNLSTFNNCPPRKVIFSDGINEDPKFLKDSKSKVREIEIFYSPTKYDSKNITRSPDLVEQVVNNLQIVRVNFYLECGVKPLPRLL
jgi:hypothetical protein